MQTITLYDAIKQMRTLSQQGRSFSFSHVTYNRNSVTCNGIRTVESALLRPAAREDKVKDSNFKIFYTDLETGEPRVAWQMLIITFNNMKVVL